MALKLVLNTKNNYINVMIDQFAYPNVVSNVAYLTSNS